jgi:hypothetical protein
MPQVKLKMSGIGFYFNCSQDNGSYLFLSPLPPPLLLSFEGVKSDVVNAILSN